MVWVCPYTYWDIKNWVWSIWVKRSGHCQKTTGQGWWRLVLSGDHGRIFTHSHSQGEFKLLEIGTDSSWLVVWNMIFFFHFIYGMSSFPLTNSIMFQRSRVETTNQVIIKPSLKRSSQDINGHCPALSGLCHQYTLLRKCGLLDNSHLYKVGPPSYKMVYKPH